jgi:hypothetical protein
MTDWIEIAEPHDLSPWQVPLRDPPAELAQIEARGVRSAAAGFMPFARLTDPGGDRVADGVWRHPDGTMTVACTTLMLGVSAAMWDWWFGWHSLSSARYRLWHPEAHIKSQLAEDRRHLSIGRARYVGNISAVDEYIGPQLTKLAIAFVPPSAFGMDEARVDRLGTAICAEVSLRGERMQTSRLVHLVIDAIDGCVMYSRFQIGQFKSTAPVIGPMLGLLANRRGPRRRLANDALGLALLRHCAEEMNHLAQILPALYQRFGED